jgi:hypothetical protein
MEDRPNPLSKVSRASSKLDPPSPATPGISNIRGPDVTPLALMPRSAHCVTASLGTPG